MKKFRKPKGLNLFEHACNCNSLEDIIAISYLFCPDFIQIGEYIFVSVFFEEEGEEAIKKVEKLEERFGKNKKLIEQRIVSAQKNYSRNWERNNGRAGVDYYGL